MADDKSSNLNGLHIHEGRLQNVEQAVSDHAVSIARLEEGLQHAVENVRAGFDLLASKIDDMVGPLARSQEQSERRLEAMGERVGALHAAATRSKARWRAVAKYAVPVLTGAAAIGLKELVVHLMRH